eukprot:5305700-Pleurochrysis_carterae.AAC.1
MSTCDEKAFSVDITCRCCHHMCQNRWQGRQHGHQVNEKSETAGPAVLGCVGFVIAQLFP